MGGFFMKEDVPVSLAEGGDGYVDKKRKHRRPCIVEGKRRKYQDGLAEQSAKMGKRVVDNNVGMVCEEESWEGSTSSFTGCTKKLRRDGGDEESGYQLVKRRRLWRVQQDCVDRKRLRSDNDCDDDYGKGGSRKKRRIEHACGFTSAASAASTRICQASDNENSTRRGKRAHNDRDVRIEERLASGMMEDFGSRSKKQRVDRGSEQDTWRRRKRKREEENEDDDNVTGVMTDFADGNAEIQVQHLSL